MKHVNYSYFQWCSTYMWTDCIIVGFLTRFAVFVWTNSETAFYYQCSNNISVIVTKDFRRLSFFLYFKWSRELNTLNHECKYRNINSNSKYIRIVGSVYCIWSFWFPECLCSSCRQEEADSWSSSSQQMTGMSPTIKVLCLWYLWSSSSSTLCV